MREGERERERERGREGGNDSSLSLSLSLAVTSLFVASKMFVWGSLKIMVVCEEMVKEIPLEHR